MGVRVGGWVYGWAGGCTGGRVGVLWAGGRAGVRYVITKFSRMNSLPNFFTHGSPLRALRKRELRYKLDVTFNALF